MSFQVPRVLKPNKSRSPSKRAKAPETNTAASSSALLNVGSLAADRRPYDGLNLHVEPERLLYAPGGPYTQPTDPASRYPSASWTDRTLADAESGYHGLANTIIVTNPVVTDVSGAERLRTQRRKAESYRKWRDELIPSLVVPYLALLKRTASLQYEPNPEWADEVPSCSHAHPRRQIKVTCVYMSSELKSPR
jgi:hypothetical protein